MRDPSRQQGFTLVEVLVGFAIGLVVLAGTAQLFNASMTVANQVNSQAEMQQNARAAVNSLVQDVSLAGTGGIPQAGIALPNGGGASNPSIACDNTPKCWVIAGGGGAANFSDAVLHVITPLGKIGQKNMAATSATDVITIAYGDSDPNFQIDCKPLTGLAQSPATGTPSSFTLTFDPTMFSALCPAAPAPKVNPLLSASDGLVVGDVLVLSNLNGIAAGVVTNITENGGAHTVTLGATDLLNYNQFGGTSGTLTTSLALTKSAPPVPSTSAFRLWVITYFVDKQPDGTLRLMRQVNARAPVPVAENIDDFVITYDTYDETVGVEKANLDASQVYSPPTVNNANNIRKVNLQVTVRSRTKVRGQYQHFRLITSVNPRALGYQDRYQ